MTDQPPIAPAPPFSRVLVAAELDEAPKMMRLEANEAERAALARDTDVPHIGSLVAELTLKREGRSTINISGRVKARATRECVVTLEPFEETIDEEITASFAPQDIVDAAERRLAEATEEDAMELPQPPDPIENGRIDLGVLAAEFFVLGLDPYPRKPGVQFQPPVAAADEADEAGDSPFAALARLKKDADRED